MKVEEITNLKKRESKEKIFHFVGFSSIIIAILFLSMMLFSIVSNGYSSFFKHKIQLEIDLTKSNLQKFLIDENNPPSIKNITFSKLIKDSIRQNFPQISNKKEERSFKKLISRKLTVEIKKILQNQPNLIGKKSKFWVSLDSKIDIAIKKSKISSDRFSDFQIKITSNLLSKRIIQKKFNSELFKNSDSRYPEYAGVASAIIGTFYLVLIALLFAFPIGVMSALYLEELAPKNLITNIIEIAINNLAAIPSIIFGILGLVIYLNFFNLPRSSSLVGGLTIFLLILPIIIIASRNAVRNVSKGVKDGALAIGASKIQIMFHHTIPIAFPGIMTGSILAVARAIGETAPLLMIGMVAFIANIPSKVTEPSSALPVQIYLWSDSFEPGFVEKTSGAIIILLALLIFLNSIASLIRWKFEKH
jgi:phosphate transport system permease protein